MRRNSGGGLRAAPQKLRAAKRGAPRSKLLRKGVRIWTASLSAHWRSVAIHMQLVVNLLGALRQEEWDAAVIGGDDLAVCQLLFQALGHPSRKVSGKLRFEVPQPQPIFHSRLRCDKGSPPHGVKLAGESDGQKKRENETSKQCVTNCDRFYSGMRGHIACVWD